MLKYTTGNCMTHASRFDRDKNTSPVGRNDMESEKQQIRVLSLTKDIKYFFI